MKMTNAQKDYINNVILPRLVEMAINDELDSDMTILSYHDFDEATEKYNNSPEQVRQREINTLAQYVSDYDRTVEEQYDAYMEADGETCIGEVLDLAEAYEDWSLISCDHFHKEHM